MEELIEQLRDLMAIIDPSLDVSQGSAFDRELLQKIRDNFGVGELALDRVDMMQRRIAQLDPEILTAGGGAVHEFLLKPLQAIMEMPLLELERIKHNQDLNNIDDMTDEEVDRRLSNFLTQRRVGEFSIGTVRAFFASPVSVSTNLTNRALTPAGLGYFPDGAFTASANLIASQKDKGLYYVDIPYVAEAPGVQYDIDPGEITKIENMPGLVRATNVEAFVGGVPRESTTAYYERTKKSLSERSLNSKNSVSTILTERFPNKVLSVSSIGYGDPEMKRDEFDVEASVLLAEIKLEVRDVASSVGGLGFNYELATADVDPTTLLVYTVTAGVPTLVLAGAGPGFYTFGDNNGAFGKDTVNFGTALGGADAAVIQYATLHGTRDLVSTIPGSIEIPPLFPAAFVGQTVHVGGKADIYVKPSTEEPASIQIRSLDRFTVFRCNDGIISLDVDDNLWYFSTARGVEIREIGALPGDVVEVVTDDPYGDPFVLEGNSFTIVKIDQPNRRFLLNRGTTGSVTIVGADIRVRLAEDRAIPLERLVAVTNFAEPIYLASSNSPITTDIFSTEFDGSSNVPVAPTLGHLNRDSSLPAFPKTFQTALPNIAAVGNSRFATRKSDQLFAVGEVSGGLVKYFVAEENIANGSLQRPWVRLTDVTALNALNFDLIESEKVRNLYPADIRSLDLSGGVDEVNEAAGKARIYFEKPINLLMYGGGYTSERTRFTRRVDREVTPGTFVTFNLKYKLTTHGPAGQPAVFVREEDYSLENGLYYVDVFVRGDHAESVRSDSEEVVESDLNLGDGAELFVGDLSLDDELKHVVDELEFEFAGEPEPKAIGNATDGVETPGDSTAPYRVYEGTWVVSTFDVTPNPEFLTNTIRVGDFLKVLELEPIATSITGTSTSFTATSITDTSKNFTVLGIRPGDRLLVTGNYYWVDSITSSSPSTPNDTLTVTPITGPPITGTSIYNVFRWNVRSTHTITDVQVDKLGATPIDIPGGPYNFVIVSQNGAFRLRNPHVRYSLGILEDGIPGNNANRAFRAEGYWLDPRNPFDRTLEDDQYTFSVEELTLFRFTRGFNTLYLPNKSPTGNDLDLPAAVDEVEGQVRDDFTFFCGKRVPIVSTDMELMVGPSFVYEEFLYGNGSPTSTSSDLVTDSADPQHLRVFVGALELLQIPYDAAAAATIPPGRYMHQEGTPDKLRFPAAYGSFPAITTGTFIGISDILTDTTVTPNFLNFFGTNQPVTVGMRVKITAPSPVLNIGTFKVVEVISATELRLDTVLPASGAITYHILGIRAQYLTKLDSVLLTDDPAKTVTLVNGALEVKWPLTLEPITAALLADFINDNSLNFYAIVSEDDAGGDAEAYYYSATATAVPITVPAGIRIRQLGVNFAVNPVVRIGDVLRMASTDYTITRILTTVTTNDTIEVATGGPALTAATPYTLRRLYTRQVAAFNELQENFTSKELVGKDIQIDYEWSRSTREVHEYASASTTRSINQDLLTRHGIPVFANVDITVNSAFVTQRELIAEIKDYILTLAQQPLETSALIRLPKVSGHIPIPVFINGLVILENRRFRVYRSLDGIDPRRVEAILPGAIVVTVAA